MTAAPDTGAPQAGAAPPLPDGSGHFGRYGGRLAPEALMSALEELTSAYFSAKADPGFLSLIHISEPTRP